MATDDQRAGTDAPAGSGPAKVGLDRTDESQTFVDTSKLDFDPDEGLYSGTAVDGTSEIPAPPGDGDGDGDGGGETGSP